MNFIKRWLLRISLRMLDSSIAIQYDKIDKSALEDWAYHSFDDKGWRSYFASEDLKILKELGNGKDRDQYMIFIGRRLQLLYLYDEMRRATENKKTRQMKKEVEAKKGDGKFKIS